MTTLRGVPPTLMVPQDRGLHRVIVERILRRGLVIPDALTGLRPHREHRVGEQIVALAGARVPGRRIADAPIDEIELRIIGAGHPARATTGELRIAFPALGARLALGRNGVGPPEMLAGLGIVAFEQAAMTELGARDAGD